MEKDKKYLLSFKGNKKELHTQLKKWCQQEGQAMSTTIFQLIQNHLNSAGGGDEQAEE